MRVAYFSPLPPERSGIADYSALLLPALSERVEVEVVRRGARRARRADVALFQIGNEPDAHGWIVDELAKRRGLVVLHEFVLHHLVAGVTLGRGDREGYLAAMQRDSGTVGRLLAHGVIDGLIDPLWETRPHDFPLAGAVLDRADAVVVHSRFVEAAVVAAGFLGRVYRIPHPAWAVEHVAPDPQLAASERFVVGCLGRLNPSKRIPQLLAAFARLRSSVDDPLLVLAGPSSAGAELDEWVERQGLALGRDVLHLDYVEENRLWALAAACDVCVNLRHPTMGETSGAAIRALGLGRPLVVSDVGWFSELPDEVATKIPLEGEVTALAAALDRLAHDAPRRAAMGDAARAYVRTEHDLGRAADLYLAAIEETAGGEHVRGALLHELAEAADEVGIGAEDPLLDDVVARMREVELGR